MESNHLGIQHGSRMQIWQHPLWYCNKCIRTFDHCRRNDHHTTIVYLLYLGARPARHHLIRYPIFVIQVIVKVCLFALKMTEKEIRMTVEFHCLVHGYLSVRVTLKKRVFSGSYLFTSRDWFQLTLRLLPVVVVKSEMRVCSVVLIELLHVWNVTSSVH